MTRPITQLTPQQQRDLHAWQEEWYAIGSGCGSTDREATRRTITAMYATLGHAPPQFVFLDSPLACLRSNGLVGCGDQLKNQLWDKLGDQIEGQLRNHLWDQLGRNQLLAQRGEDQLRAQLGGDQLGNQLWDQLGGQIRNQLWDQLRVDQLLPPSWSCFYGTHEAYWIAFYRFCARIGMQYPPGLAMQLGWWETLVRSCGWWWPYTHMCFVSERPRVQHVDHQRRLHCAEGPAMAFRDGFGLWAWHGVRVAQAVIEHPETITLAQIRDERNAEVQRVLLERFGWERYMEAVGATLLAADTEPVGPAGLRGLFATTDGHRILVCTCASTGKTFHLAVPPEVDTCQQASEWLAQEEDLRLLGQS